MQKGQKGTAQEPSINKNRLDHRHFLGIDELLLFKGQALVGDLAGRRALALGT